MGKGQVATILVLIVGALLLLAALKIAIKLAFVAIIIVGAAAVVMAARKMIGKN